MRQHLLIVLLAALCLTLPTSTCAQLAPSARPPPSPSPPHPPRPPPPSPGPPPPSPPAVYLWKDVCNRLIVTDKRNAVSMGASAAALSSETCNMCRNFEVGCPVGMNNHTHRVVFASFIKTFTCKPGGIERFDPEFNVTTTYCREGMTNGAIASLVVAPIFVMLLMCACAFCMPCVKRCFCIHTKSPEIPKTELSATMTQAAGAVPPSPLHQMERDDQPGCCSAPFEKAARMHELPSYDVSKYSTAERECIAYSIDQYIVLFTQPPYMPEAVPRCFTRFLVSTAMRPSCGCGVGTIAWLVVAVLDAVSAALSQLCRCCCAAPSWYGVDALLKDMWFYFKQHHALLCIMPYLRHPLHPVARHVHIVSFLTQALFTYFTSYVLELANVGADSNEDYTLECGRNCDAEVHQAASGYGHSAMNSGASTSPAVIVAIGIISALFNTPWKVLQTMLTSCFCCFCCNSRSRFRVQLAGVGFRLWSIVGLPVAVVLFVLAIDGARNPNLTALKWAISIISAQLGFDNIFAVIAFLRAYRAELLEELKQPTSAPKANAPHTADDVEKHLETEPLPDAGAPGARDGKRPRHHRHHQPVPCDPGAYDDMQRTGAHAPQERAYGNIPPRTGASNESPVDEGATGEGGEGVYFYDRL